MSRAGSSAAAFPPMEPKAKKPSISPSSSAPSMPGLRLASIASKTFTSAGMTAKPPQGHDAKCGLACHTSVKDLDYVFTEYAPR